MNLVRSGFTFKHLAFDNFYNFFAFLPNFGILRFVSSLVSRKQTHDAAEKQKGKLRMHFAWKESKY